MSLEQLLDFLENYARKPAVFTLVCVLILLWVLKLGWAPVSNPKNVFDSYSYYYAAKAISQGQNPYDNDILKGMAKSEAGFKDVYPYLYPPFLAGFWRPLTALSPLQAHKALIIANIILMALNFWLLFKIVRPQRHPHALFLSYLIFQPVNYTLLMTVKLGQINPLVMLLVLLCLHCHLKGRETLSAASLSIAILLKLTPGILLLYFLFFYPRRWKYLLKVVATMAGLVLLSFLAAPPVNWLYFVQNTLSGPPYITFGSFWGQLAIASRFSPFLTQYKLWLYLLLGLTIVVLSLRKIRQVHEPQRVIYAFSSLILVSLAISPLTWYHHYYFCLLTFFYLPVVYREQGGSSLSLFYITMVFLMLTRIPEFFGDFMGPSFAVLFSLTKTILTFAVLLVTILVWPKSDSAPTGTASRSNR